MSEELIQNESHSQSSIFRIFLKFFSFLVPLFDVIKLIIASVTSVVFLAFAGLTLAGSALALVVSTPLFIIFSPILVPATMATTLLATGLTAGATLGVSAISLILGLIRTAEGTSLAAKMPTRRSGGGGNQMTAALKKRIAAGRGGGGTGGGSFDWKTLIKKIIALIKKYQQGKPAGGGSEPAGGADPSGGATPPGGADPAGGATPPS